MRGSSTRNTTAITASAAARASACRRDRLRAARGAASPAGATGVMPGVYPLALDLTRRGRSPGEARPPRERPAAGGQHRLAREARVEVVDRRDVAGGEVVGEG